MALHMMSGVEDLVGSGGRLAWSLAHQTLKRWYRRGVTAPCRQLLDAWVRVGGCYQMTEGRLCQIHLLDDRSLELLVQPRLLSRELLDLVSSHFNLKEKEYFGLSFIDDTGQSNWLQLERRVLDHDFSKKSSPLELRFLVRFYIEKITFLKDNTTVELFYLNAKSSVCNETVEVESEHVFTLAALALQEAKGEHTRPCQGWASPWRRNHRRHAAGKIADVLMNSRFADGVAVEQIALATDETAREDLKQLPLLPTRVLREHPSLTYCEDRVIEHYKKLQGVSRGQAIVQYLALVESLPTYGVHYYPVKDKQGIPWWLGISYKGIGQFDLQDKLKPRKLYQWKQLENLYFREKKFAVEVNDPHRRTVTKRTFGQAGLAKLTTTRSSGDIAMDLTEISVPRIRKISSTETRDQLIMASNGSLISADSLDSEISDEQKKEKIADLKKKGKDLEDKLAKKLEELKSICMREAELTGKLPQEYPLASGEKAPHVRRRVGTAFKLDDLFPYDKDPYLRNLESCFALQQKIVEAAMKLSNEGDLKKTVKKKRKNNCLDAMRKLQDIEDEINIYRKKMGQKPTQRASLIFPDDSNPSELSSLSDSLTLDDDEELGSQRLRSRSVQYSPRPHHAGTLDIHYGQERRASDQPPDNRLKYGQEPQQGPLSGNGSPYRPPPRQPQDARSMPPTPVLPRNAFSSTQLRSDDAPQHFRQRSGSLESQSRFLPEAEPPAPAFHQGGPRRSTSTDPLEDGSSYTSQSSAEYGGSRPGHRAPARQRVRARRKDIYANTGSMPNLAQPNAQPEPRCHVYQPRQRPTTTAYYVTGYPSYPEPEPYYSNGGYAYDGNEMEGHYSDPYGRYGDEMDGGMSSVSDFYATLRPPKARPAMAPAMGPPQQMNVQKAMVAEHLRGWYQRNTGTKQPSFEYEYEREHGSQQSLGYQTMPAPYSQNGRSYSTASCTGNWQAHAPASAGQYDAHAHQPYSCNTTAHYGQPAHGRSYVDLNQGDPHVMSSPEDRSMMDRSMMDRPMMDPPMMDPPMMDPPIDDHLHWHETSSKPGTI
ncbi:hypothetical protein NHX12_030484, partial [Muraenolepis orangiensis]